MSNVLPRPDELRPLDPVSPASLPVATLKATLIIPVRNAGHSLEETAAVAHRHFESRYGESFEILIVCHADDSTAALARELSTRYPRLRSITHTGPLGKGANLRAGFLESRGKAIFFTDADLPYELSFIDQAAARLEAGYDFVTGNRRLPASVFRLSVNLLKIAYGRHRLGLWFNAVVRRLLPIRTTDTQAGIKALSRELASVAFTRQRCPGFFYDLELFLVAQNQGFQWIELPVVLHLNSEKSTVRVLRESCLAAFWLLDIFRANRRGHYGKRKTRPNVPRLYPSLDLGTRTFLRARWALTPYSRIAAELPPAGDILDLGCGHGLLAIAAALGSRRRQVLGVDHDARRVELAQAAAEKLAQATTQGNLHFEQGNLPALPEGKRFSAVTLIDVMHYFDEATQAELVARASEALEPGGRLLVREVDPDGGMIARWNRLYEKIATSTGFTKSARHSDVHFRTVDGWKALFSDAGFRVSAAPCTSPLFSDVLFVCEKDEA